MTLGSRIEIIEIVGKEKSRNEIKDQHPGTKRILEIRNIKFLLEVRLVRSENLA